MLDVTFYGVRGSTPCSCHGTQGVGGNTSCVMVQSPLGDPPLVLDLGSGLRYLGTDLIERGITSFVGTALVTHLHWDHIQGIPFFVPLLNPDAKLRLVGPPQVNSTLAAEVKSFVRPPLFPVDLERLPCTIEFLEIESGIMAHGSSLITVAPVAHIGPTSGYRIDNGDASVVYIPDHQQPIDGSLEVPESVVNLCADADLLIHDAQYDAEEFVAKSTWGHSTIDYAAEVARRSGVRRLVLFHHDPGHDDDWVARGAARVQDIVGDSVEVLVAYEGLTIRSGSVITV